MEKRYLFSAYWRKEDVEFLKQFKLSRNIQEGFKGFTVDEKTHDLIMMRYNKKNIFRSIKPKEFQVIFTGVTFTQEEIDNAKYYVLYSVGDPIGYPQPEQGYAKQVFDFKECNFIRNNRKQKAYLFIKFGNLLFCLFNLPSCLFNLLIIFSSLLFTNFVGLTFCIRSTFWLLLHRFQSFFSFKQPIVKSDHSLLLFNKCEKD